MTWRRLSDWKSSIHLVHLDELPDALMDEHGWRDPVEVLRPSHPELADALESGGFVRVSAEAGALLNAAGVCTTEVAYHRGNDTFGLTNWGPQSEQTDTLCMVDLDLPEEQELPDVVDAVLQIWTEQFLSERIVLLAAAAPALDDTSPDLSGLDALDLSQLPSASDALLDVVADAVARHRPFVPGPRLTHDERRAYQRQVALVGGLCALGSAVALMTVPMLLVVTVPPLLLCAIVYAIHWAVIRQER